jgi:hypothetical protein
MLQNIRTYAKLIKYHTVKPYMEVEIQLHHS